MKKKRKQGEAKSDTRRRRGKKKSVAIYAQGRPPPAARLDSQEQMPERGAEKFQRWAEEEEEKNYLNCVSGVQ